MLIDNMTAHEAAKAKEILEKTSLIARMYLPRDMSMFLEARGEFEKRAGIGVYLDETRTSALPMASFHFGYCTGLVIYDSNLVSLSHITHSTKVWKFVQESVDDQKKNAGELSALILSARRDRASDMERACRTAGIRDISTIFDCTHRRLEGKSRVASKHIVVVPEKRQVAVYTPARKHLLFY